MERVWLYVALLVVGAVVGVILARTVRTPQAKRRLSAWMLVVFGGCFLLMYALDVDRDTFPLIMGVACVVAGAHTFESVRLREQVERLENELNVLRHGQRP